MEPFEKKIQKYTETVQEKFVRESAVLETIRGSENAFIKQEDRLLTYAEFLYQQARYIGKRWWILQGLVLASLLFLLNDAGGIYAQRTLGAGASLFAVLVIPELWKNRRTSAMEIEGTSFYSLRQIYSARILLLGMADLLLLTLFYAAAAWTAQLSLGTFIINFVVPFNISCCICFRILCSRRAEMEYVAGIICLAWAAVWMMFLGQDRVYEKIAVPVWAALLVCSLVYLVWCVRKAQKDCESIWEVNRSWN